MLPGFCHQKPETGTYSIILFESDIRKSDNGKGLSQMNFLLSETNAEIWIFHQIANLELLSMQYCAWLHRTKSTKSNILSETSTGPSFSNALPILHKKFFANLDKTKDFEGSKFSLCLNQRETINSMEKQDIRF